LVLAFGGSNPSAPAYEENYLPGGIQWISLN
jgi:hypothetical protein